MKIVIVWFAEFDSDKFKKLVEYLAQNNCHFEVKI